MHILFLHIFISGTYTTEVYTSARTFPKKLKYDYDRRVRKSLAEKAAVDIKLSMLLGTRASDTADNGNIREMLSSGSNDANFITDAVTGLDDNTDSYADVTGSATRKSLDCNNNTSFKLLNNDDNDSEASDGVRTNDDKVLDMAEYINLSAFLDDDDDDDDDDFSSIGIPSSADNSITYPTSSTSASRRDGDNDIGTDNVYIPAIKPDAAGSETRGGTRGDKGGTRTNNSQDNSEKDTLGDSGVWTTAVVIDTEANITSTGSSDTTRKISEYILLSVDVTLFLLESLIKGIAPILEDGGQLVFRRYNMVSNPDPNLRISKFVRTVGKKRGRKKENDEESAAGSWRLPAGFTRSKVMQGEEGNTLR